MGDAGGDFIEERLLGFAERGFRQELKVLLLEMLSNVSNAYMVLSTYSCALEDFAKPGKVVHTRVQCINGGIKELEGRLEGGNGRGESHRSSHGNKNRDYFQY